MYSHSNRAPTTARGCPVALSQGHCTFWHDQVLHCLASGLSEILAEAEVDTIYIYADLPGMRANEPPQGTIPSSLMVITIQILSSTMKYATLWHCLN